MKRLLLLSVFALWFGLSQAQDTIPEMAIADSNTTASVSVEPVDEGPVPVPEPSEKAMKYYRTGMGWWFFNNIWGWLIPGLILFFGFSAKIRDFAQGLTKSWYLQVVIYFATFMLLTYIIDFGFSYWQGYVRAHAYDMSNQTFGKWFGDSLKGLGIGLVMGALFVWIPFRLLKAFPKRWWLYFGLGAIPFIFLINMLAPVFISPLFNDFGEMKDKALEQKILALAERAGIEGSRVYEVNKSVDTKAVNAYVAGFGATKRIVLWDTTIDKLEEDELLFVMGHEMGHYVLNHVIGSILLMSVVILLGLFGIHKTAHFLIDRYKHRFGFTELHDVAALPLIMLMFSIYGFILSPALNIYSRHNEHESDRFGLEILQDNHAAASAFAKLQEENLGNPRPGVIFKLWRASHPVLGDRIDFCNTYKPWETGEALKYGHLFKE